MKNFLIVHWHFQIFKYLEKIETDSGVELQFLLMRKYPALEIFLPERYSYLEICAVQIVCNNVCIKLICVYRPPSTVSTKTTEIIECLKWLTQDCNSFVICGDFNFPDIIWTPPHATSGSSLEFLNFLNSEGYYQYLSEPTHKDGNILDLIIGPGSVFCQWCGDRPTSFEF